jgi:antitoxin component YwqK of YwqJK toxin-antitoxin module
MKRIPALFLSVPILLSIFSCTNVKTEKWPDGSVKSEITIKNGLRNGPARYWYQNGNIQMECGYVDDRLNGLLTRYFPYPGGIREEQQTFRNDTLEGEDLTWDRSGNLRVQAQFSRGRPNGSYREFYENKMIKTEGNYRNGSTDGLWLYYDETGNVIGKGMFKMGDGEQRSFFPGTNRIKMITRYKNNLRDGAETEYSPDGKPLRTRIFCAGKLLEVQEAAAQ